MFEGSTEVGAAVKQVKGQQTKKKIRRKHKADISLNQTNSKWLFLWRYSLVQFACCWIMMNKLLHFSSFCVSCDGSFKFPSVLRYMFVFYTRVIPVKTHQVFWVKPVEESQQKPAPTTTNRSKIFPWWPGLTGKVRPAKQKKKQKVIVVVLFVTYA